MKTDAFRASWNDAGGYVQARWVRAPGPRDLPSALRILERVVRGHGAPYVLERVIACEAGLAEHADWLHANWVPCLAAAGVRRLAVVMSSSAFSKLDLSQSVIRQPELNFVRHCFFEEGAALRWFARQQFLLHASVSPPSSDRRGAAESQDPYLQRRLPPQPSRAAS